MEHTAENRERSSRNITLWGVAVNIVLAVIKTVGGIVGHSAALLADGVHSLSDLVSDAMVLFAARRASTEADEDHPYGHERFETLATALLGGLLVLVGIGIAWDGVDRLIADEPLQLPHLVTAWIAAISIASKEVLYHLTRRVGHRIRSRMLEANAWHHRSDAISSVVVLIGIGGAHMGYPMLDAYAAIVVAIMIMKIGIELAQQGIMELVDTALEPDQVDDIRQAILSITDVRQLHMLRTRRMGQNALVDVHIEVSPRLSVSEGHHISEKVEHLLTDRFEDINDVTVHIDPENDEDEAACMHLPLRSELIGELQRLWAAVPEFDGIEDVTLHYLRGKIHVEATLPLQRLADIEAAGRLQQRFDETSTQVDGIGKGILRFG